MRKLRLNLGQKQSIVTSLTAAIAVFLVFILVALSTFILIRGGHYFWPQPTQVLLLEAQHSPQQTYFVIPTATTVRVDQELLHFQFSNANKLFNGQLTIPRDQIQSLEPLDSIAQIRLDNGGAVIAKIEHLIGTAGHPLPISEFAAQKSQVEVLSSEIEAIRFDQLASIHDGLAQMDRRGVEPTAPAREKLQRRFYELQASIEIVERKIETFKLKIAFADGTRSELLLNDVEGFVYPNTLSVWQKTLLAISEFFRFVSDSPKLDNTSGGVFPALFGTIVMVLIMTIIVTPFGVLAAVYLHEYAPQNKLTALIRISVNNLAGIPSIVYGVFGLGFFVYIVGGNIDALFFEDQLPSPTFGAPGIFWASLTMAILTLPVVIVATEEGLRRVPKTLRYGSYALGATQAETVFKMILPIASPGIMTGVILAIARGAGEVAPLMLVGAVKFAPALPVDGDFPFVHLQRQFMHLGVLIYDGAFHSQNIGNGSSFVFACCMLLLMVVLSLNLVAISIRNRLRKQYAQI